MFEFSICLLGEILSRLTTAEEAELAVAARPGSVVLIWSQERDTTRQTDGIKTVPPTQLLNVSWCDTFANVTVLFHWLIKRRLENVIKFCGGCCLKVQRDVQLKKKN